MLEGTNCRAEGFAGVDFINDDGTPSEGSAVIGTANRRYAPRVDFTGRRRDSSPDVGAFEYHG